MLPVRTVSALLSLGVLATAALTGCGGDGDTLSHADVVKQANAACKTAAAEIAKIPAPKDQAELAAYTAKMTAATGALHKTIDGLEPSSTTDKKAVATYAAGIARANAALTALGTAAKAGDAGRVKAQAARIEKLNVGILAARAGLGTCATAVAPSA